MEETYVCLGFTKMLFQLYTHGKVLRQLLNQSMPIAYWVIYSIVTHLLHIGQDPGVGLPIIRYKCIRSECFCGIIESGRENKIHFYSVQRQNRNYTVCSKTGNCY